MQDTDSFPVNRRALMRLAAFGVAVGSLPTLPLAHAQSSQDVAGSQGFTKLRSKVQLNIGIMIYPGMDQIDFTGPFAVLVRVPGATIHVIGTEHGPLADHKGLMLTPTVVLADAPEIDLLVIPGGPGQEALMDNELVQSYISNHVAAAKPLFSVCTGALLCGAAGVLQGKRATTHWSAFDLLPLFGALPINERVVVDGDLVTAAGVTAGIDGAFLVAALLRGDAAAQGIQLDIQYAPEPPFQAGSPDTAPPVILAEVRTRFAPLTDKRRQTAQTVAKRLGITVD